MQVWRTCHFYRSLPLWFCYFSHFEIMSAPLSDDYVNISPKMQMAKLHR